VFSFSFGSVKRLSESLSQKVKSRCCNWLYKPHTSHNYCCNTLQCRNQLQCYRYPMRSRSSVEGVKL